MIILLDTNVFWADVHAAKGWLSSVLDGARHGDFEVVVPEVVIHELVRQYPERLKQTIDDANIAIGRLNKELGRLNLSEQPRVVHDTASLIASYEAGLRGRLSGPGCRIEPHPPDMATIVDWAVQRRRPFKESGVGAPDATIWLTVLGLAASGHEVRLVSTNHDDFGDGATPAGLAKELLADLRDLKLPTDRVRLITSMGALVEEVVQPLGAADVRAERLLANPGLNRALRDELERSLLYSPFPCEGLALGVSLDDDPQPLGVDLDALELIAAREGPDDRLLVELLARADLHLYMDILRLELEAAAGKTIVRAVDPERMDHVVQAEAVLSAWLTLDVLVDIHHAGLEAEVDVTAAVRLTDDEVFERRLRDGPLKSLFDELSDNGWRTWPDLEGYLPGLPLSSPISAAEVTDFTPVSCAVLAVDARHDSDDVWCALRVTGYASVRWIAEPPSAFDRLRHEDLLLRNAAGASLITAVDGSELLVLNVDAILDDTDAWLSLDVTSLGLRPDEQRRRERADDEELAHHLGMHLPALPES